MFYSGATRTLPQHSTRHHIAVRHPAPDKALPFRYRADMCGCPIPRCPTARLDCLI